MLARLKAVVKRIPGAVPAYRAATNAVHGSRSVEGKFTTIYEHNVWGDPESVSGSGSNLAQTRVLVAALGDLLRARQFRTMLDIPCGDFQWMSQVAMDEVDYTGADLVEELVAANEARFGGPRRRFRKLDVITDPLPAVDVVFCRDCLVHLPTDKVFKALRNLEASGSTYLLTTTFPEHANRRNIVAGQWRPLNLEAAPFQLPPPDALIVEQCDEDDGQYRDKSMGLWKLADLRTALG